MENLKIIGSKQALITSVDLVNIINEFREMESNRAVLRHNDFMAKIKKELEVLQSVGLGGEGNISESTYTDKQNRERPCYLLNRERVKYLADRTSNTDKLGLMEAYKQLGGEEVEISVLSRFEDSFMSKLGQVLDELDIDIEREYSVLDYRIDGYIEEYNLAIEYDEAHHEYQVDEDKAREKEIEKEIGCQFIRLDYEDTDATNIGKIIKIIMEV